MRSVHAVGSFIIAVSSCFFAAGGVIAALQGDPVQGTLYAAMAVGVMGYATLVARLADAGTNRMKKLVSRWRAAPTPPVDPYGYDKVMARYRAAHRRPIRSFGHWRLGYHK